MPLDRSLRGPEAVLITFLVAKIPTRGSKSPRKEARYSVWMAAISRRQLLRDLWATTMGFSGLLALGGCSSSGGAGPAAIFAGFGPLRRDPLGILDLPAGFSYRVLSLLGQRMDDGLLVPGAMDGMQAFQGPGRLVVLVRNHELDESMPDWGAFGKKHRLARLVDSSRFYDPRGPSLGGTTTAVYDPDQNALVRQFLSLCGTLRNCAGGRTPWGSWLSCEETVVTKDSLHDRDHGYVFEVPATVTPQLTPAVPLTAMGRFRHEAAVVDPATGVVYMTEDQVDGLCYRFLPHTRGELHRGGRLEALALLGQKSAFTGTGILPDTPLPTQWVPVDDVQSPNDDLRTRGFAAGAAQFVRGEGVYAGRDGIYFCCTAGGDAGIGQIWKYVPSPNEGTSQETLSPGQLILLLESRSSQEMSFCDNLTIAPWGDVVFCEDCSDCGNGGSRLMGLDRAGRTYPLALNRANGSELAGATFSPDGTVLFVNIQFPGATLAIRGPWPTGA